MAYVSAVGLGVSRRVFCYTAGMAVFLSVIIPAFNEEKRLPKTLRDVVAYLRSRTYAWEVVVVDDGSRDRTSNVVQTVRLEEPRVRLLAYRQNRGKGYAVRYGMAHASGEVRLFMDADNSTTIDQVAAFFPYLRQGFDVVVGSRDVPGAEIGVHQPWWKEKLGDLGNSWSQFSAVPGIKDTQAGFKVFSGAAADDVFPRLTIDRWGFDVEALAVARRRGWRLTERPIRWVNDADSKVTPAAYVHVLLEVAGVWFKLWRGKYDDRS